MPGSLFFFLIGTNPILFLYAAADAKINPRASIPTNLVIFFLLARVAILDMILSELEFISPAGPTTPSAKNITAIKNRQQKLKDLHNRFKDNLSNQVKTV